MRLSREVFSFNNPFGACPDCLGLGYKMEFDERLMIPDPSLSIEEGAIAVLGWQSCATKGSFTRAILDALCKEYHFDLSTPFQDYPKEIHDILIHGTNGHEVKVYYKGQRGEGVYDVAFEGLIKKCGAQIPGDRFGKFQTGIRDFYADHAVPCLQRPASETGSTGSDSWSKKIFLRSQRCLSRI